MLLFYLFSKWFICLLPLFSSYQKETSSIANVLQVQEGLNSFVSDIGFAIHLLCKSKIILKHWALQMRMKYKEEVSLVG